MADVTIGLLARGYLHLTLDVGYAKHTIRINITRIEKGLRAMDRATAEEVWRFTVKWYFIRFNPDLVTQKTQKSLDNALLQVSPSSISYQNNTTV